MPEQTSNSSDRAGRDKALFNRIAQSYCEKDQVESSRVARKHRLLQTIKPCKNSWAIKPAIMEIGCGAGYSAEYLKGYFSEYTGIDYSAELVQYARHMYDCEEIHFHIADFYDFESKDKFDIIFMIGVLHHMTDIQGALKKCLSLLKPGGYLVANEPQPDNAVVHFMRKLRAKIDSSYSAEQEELSAGFLIEEYEKAGSCDVAAIPQGLFSTPFAEVVLRPQLIFRPLSKLACGIDGFLEQKHPELIRNLTWNTIVFGRNKYTGSAVP